MIAAWLVFIPTAIIIARFYKVTPRQNWPSELDNPFWFIWHRRLGWISISFTALAIAAITLRDVAPFDGAQVHAVAGWTVVALGMFQIINAILRGSHGGPVNPFTRVRRPPEQWAGDHYDMTQRRIIFEYLHKLAGYVVLPLALVTVGSGLWVVDAPRWMWIGLMMACVAFAVVFARLQSRGRCVDTYQAIWGTDAALPGNRRAKPIGWGVQRGADRGVKR